MSKFKFKQNDIDKIKKAVTIAESKTSGEIATAIIKESDNYAFFELLFALIVGFIYFFVIMFFTDKIESIIKQMFWDYSNNYLLAFYGFSTFLIISLFYLFANIPFIDKLIVPHSIMNKKVNQRAVRYFMESGVYNTKDRTGILIFISILEKRVELLADKGINSKINQNEWDSIVGNITKGIKINEIFKHLSESILTCGQLLEKHFPIQKNDKNELRDDIDILEK